MQRAVRATTVGNPYKSWGEEQIARLLERNDICFQYEYPLALLDDGKLRIYYPDFRLPDYGGLIIEYFGLKGDPSYDSQSRHKTDLYKQAGIEAILLDRDSLRGDWPTRIVSAIETNLRNRLSVFCSRRTFMR
jgi:DNA helicase-4